jgi:Subtilase family
MAVRKLLRGFALLATALYPELAAPGVASLDKLWPTKEPLKICFQGGTAKARSEIAAVAMEWTGGTSLVLDFGSAPKYNTCLDGTAGGVIRVGFSEAGFWSYIGTDARIAMDGHPTLNLSGMQDGAEGWRAIVLHQFGHALGLLHQEQDPSGECAGEFNQTSIADRTRWPDAMVERNLAPVVPDNGRFLTTGFDRDSVMRILTDPMFFNRGEASPCYGPLADRLSAGDKLLANRIYPPKPPDVSATQETPRLSIRFEGMLAGEHFGYVLSALYDYGFISLKKHIDTVGVNISQVLIAERSTPQNVVSASFENFLCRINPHICTRAGGKAVWRNVAATKNYREGERECGDLSLEKYVFCIPNTRLEPYRIVVDVPYVSTSGSLQDLVVRTTQGCTTWDTTCQIVVKRLNREITSSFLPTGELPSSFSGHIQLPATAYRLSIEYGTLDDRNTIDRIINEVKKQRARALNVAPDKIAIFITDPIGNPVAQQSEPIVGVARPGYAVVLRTMHYPVADQDTQTQLSRFPRVHVAIWDTHVDKTHCDLQDLKRPGTSLIEFTESGIPTDEHPPDTASECDALHRSDYKPSIRWDHGTHVAGIIAGQGNAKGIVGVNPSVRVWAWEVISGDQFNRGDEPLLQLSAEHDLDPLVINISQTFPVKVGAKKTSLETLLFGDGQKKGLHIRRLIVAAAGVAQIEDAIFGKRIDSTSGSECVFFPACWSNADGESRNIISVVALNREGTDLLKRGDVALTNYGEAFDVSAVGEAHSTMHGNWVGVMQGSSFASAYVTGLASLIIAKVKFLNANWTIPELKHRILFSADNDPPLQQTSRFGRINFERALAFEDDILITRAPTSQQCPTCRVVGLLDRNRPRAVTFMRSFGSAPVLVPIQVQSIRRLKSDGDGVYTVYNLEEDGRLRKRESMALMNPDEKLFVRTSLDSSSISIRMGDIIDFVSCSFSPLCGGIQ